MHSAMESDQPAQQSPSEADKAKPQSLQLTSTVMERGGWRSQLSNSSLHTNAPQPHMPQQRPPLSSPPTPSSSTSCDTAMASMGSSGGYMKDTRLHNDGKQDIPALNLDAYGDDGSGKTSQGDPFIAGTLAIMDQHRAGAFAPRNNTTMQAGTGWQSIGHATTAGQASGAAWGTSMEEEEDTRPRKRSRPE